MPKEKVIRKYVALTPRMDEMAEEIRVKKGLKSFTSVLELAVMEYYSQTFKDYVIARTTQLAKTPEERAQQSIDIQRIKKEKEEAVYLAIVAKLGGKVLGPENDKRVQYYTYDKSNRYMQEVPLEMMDEEMVETQYYPSKEDILKRQKEGKVNYDPKSWD